MDANVYFDKANGEPKDLDGGTGTFIPNLTQFLGTKKLSVGPTVAVLRSQGQVSEGLLRRVPKQSRTLGGTRPSGHLRRLSATALRLDPCLNKWNVLAALTPPS